MHGAILLTTATLVLVTAACSAGESTAAEPVTVTSTSTTTTTSTVTKTPSSEPSTVTVTSRQRVTQYVPQDAQTAEPEPESTSDDGDPSRWTLGYSALELAWSEQTESAKQGNCDLYEANPSDFVQAYVDFMADEDGNEGLITSSDVITFFDDNC